MIVTSGKVKDKKHLSHVRVLWNPSCEATPFAPEKWPFKMGGLSSGVEINTFMFRFTLSRGLSRGVASQKGGLSKGVPLCSLREEDTIRKVPLVGANSLSVFVFDMFKK